MLNYKKDFLQLAIDIGALRFGKFKLKSGRISPYFFNASVFFYGNLLPKLANYYCQAIKAEGLKFEGLIGLAYKGIPLATSVGILLAQSGLSVPITYNRKEMKDHGERGIFFGAVPKGNLLAIDDVITAGTAVSDSIHFLSDTEAKISCVCVALDRGELSLPSKSAAEDLAERHNIKVISIINFTDLLTYIERTNSIGKTTLDAIKSYRRVWTI